MTGLIGDALVWLGVATLVLASIGAALPGRTLVRLHYLGLAGMLGVPVLLVGVIVKDPSDAIKLVLIGLLVVATAPIGSAANARATQRTSARDR